MDRYERLKTDLPEIAKAVNEFASEQVQKRAFDALLRALEIDGLGEVPSDDSHAPAAAPEGEATPSKKPRQAAPANGDAGSATRRNRSKPTLPSIDKSLDLYPAGAQSFPEFAVEKAPRNDHERCVVSVFYLKDKLSLEAVNASQVFTCFKEAGWKLPADTRNTLQATASRSGWLDTQDMSDIKVTPSGHNQVARTLPAKAKN